jgi:uncharacterized membrane protein
MTTHEPGPSDGSRGKKGRAKLPETSLTIWHYGSAMGASAGEVRLRNLEQHKALTVIDAVTLVWMPATPEPRVGRLRSRTGAGARRGAVLGALAGALVLAPAAGAVAGAGVGALASRLHNTGIDQEFLEELKGRLHPGSSALLVLCKDVDLDAVRPVLERGRARGDVTLMHALLHENTPDAIRELLAGLATVPDPPDSGDPAPTAPTLGSSPSKASPRPSSQARRRKEKP